MRNPVWHQTDNRRWCVFIADRDNCGRWWRCAPAVSITCPTCGAEPYFACLGSGRKAVATCHPSRLQAYRDAGKPGQPVRPASPKTPADDANVYPFPGIGRNP